MMERKNLFEAVLLLCIFLLTAGLTQSNIPDRPESWVTDYANLLHSGQKETLDERLRQLEKNSSTQVFVAIFKKLPEGHYLEDFVNRLFEKWRPGRSQENNGVLLAIFLEERILRIEVGYGLEDVLTDAQSKTVIDEYMVPHFRQGNYFQGISNGLDAIIGAVEGKFQIPVDEESEKPDSIVTLPTFGDFILPIIIFIIFLFLILRSRGRSSKTYSRKGQRNHPWGGPIIWGGPFGGFGGSGRSGGGGFGGGFGGLSGGGGASGSW